MSEADILVTDTVTKLGPEAEGAVLISASHGGVYAGHEAALAGVRAVILHDAAVGLDAAGITSLGYLDTLGIAAATVCHHSAVIGDGRSMADRGIISFVNDAAASLGCAPGQTAIDCARAMQKAERPAIAIPHHAEARFVIRQSPGQPVIRGCDSVSLVRAEDEDDIVITASHGELLAGSPSWGSRPDVLAAVFNDAGSTTVTRLPDLDTRGIAGATVAAASARIGDARSTWQTGIISQVNERAKSLGATTGLTTTAFADLIVAAARREQHQMGGKP